MVSIEVSNIIKVIWLSVLSYKYLHTVTVEEFYYFEV